MQQRWYFICLNTCTCTGLQVLPGSHFVMRDPRDWFSTQLFWLSWTKSSGDIQLILLIWTKPSHLVEASSSNSFKNILLLNIPDFVSQERCLDSVNQSQKLFQFLLSWCGDPGTADQSWKPYQSCSSNTA